MWGKIERRLISVVIYTLFMSAWLLLAAPAHAADVIFDPEIDHKAIGITNLEIGGIFYDVTFPEQKTAEDVYGPPPGVFTFNKDNIFDAVNAVNAALNADPDNTPFWVGVENGAIDESTQVYLVGFGINKVGELSILDSHNGQNLGFDIWRDISPIEKPAYSIDLRTFAVFTEVPEDGNQPPAEPDGEPFLVNTIIEGGQEDPDVSQAAAGFAVVWESDAEVNEVIRGQLLDQGGNDVGDEFSVSVGDRAQTNPAVARAADFVVVWQSTEDLGDNILGQVFDAQGDKPAIQFVVNTYLDDGQEFPDVASDGQGNFVVVYESFKHPFDGDGDAIVGQRFSSSGGRQGTEFLVNTIVEDDQQDPSVGRQPDGDFLVAWESDDTNNTGIFARLYNASGVAQGMQFGVNQVGENNQESPDVGAWPGGYVVAWTSPDEMGIGIWARRFGSDGVALGDQFPVNTVQDLDQRLPSVSVFEGGEFVIVWEDDDFGVAGQEFKASGEKLGGQFPVALSDAMEERPRVAVGDGGFLTTWFGAGAELNDVFARNYVVPEPGQLTMLMAGAAFLFVARKRRGVPWTER